MTLFRVPHLLLSSKRQSRLTQHSEDRFHPQQPKVVIGRVLGSHGVRGEVRVQVLSDLPHRFDPGELVFLESRPVRIQSSSQGSGNRMVIKLEGIDGPAAARASTGQELLALAKSDPQLPEGEYFHYQLIGLQVFTEEGEDLGSITEIIATGSNDVYVVSGTKGEILLPALAQVILRVDPAEGIMKVRLMEGLR